MRAFVTGATGYLGSHLVSALNLAGYTVIGYLHDGHNQQRAQMAHWAFGDLSDIGKLEKVLAKYRIDVVFHLAAQSEVGVANNDPTGTFKTNIEGTWNILEACRRQKIKRVILASSDKAYGNGAIPYLESQALCSYGIYATS